LLVLESLSEELILKCRILDSHCGGYKEFCLKGYNSVKVNQHFGGTCYFHLQGRRISQARNQHEAVSTQSCLLSASCWYFAWIILWPWRWRQCIPL
jgi:hypothetical protein